MASNKMDETITIAETDPPIWRDSSWYQGLSLAERVAYKQVYQDNHQDTAGDASLAASRLQAWKDQRPFQQGALFAERLAQDGLTEEDFLVLLAEPIQKLQERIPGIPAWLSAIREAYDSARQSGQVLSFSQEILSSHPLGAGLPAIWPLLQRGLATIQERIQGLQHEHGFLPFDSQQFTQIFLENLAHDLLFQMCKPVILEMHIARLERRLSGETPEDRFMDFIRQLAREEGILLFLARYPVLARHLVMTIDQWTDYAGEFLTHLCADWHDLCTAFSPGRDPGLLVELKAEVGDRHQNGRSVMVVRFSSGLRLLYKPKPFAIVAHFQELLVWLNEKGAEPPLRTLNLIDRGKYGWSEFVEAFPCASEDEIIRFYERQGSYLALLYALNAVDLHNENIIASGEHPMLVDLEALFHPRSELLDPDMPANLATSEMDRSVWQVGLLPRRLWLVKDSAGVDMSGLGGGEGQLLPHPLFTWKNPGTDQMQLVRQQVEMPVSHNRPRLNESEVNVLDYQEAVLTGFTRMYRLLYSHRAALLSEQLPRFEHDEIRFLARSTRVYATLLFESFHPDLLRDALERDRFFDHLWSDVQNRPYLARLIPAEQRDLQRWDIPLFTTTPNGTTVYTSEKEPLAGFLDIPSLERVQKKIQQLGEEDLAKQVWIIRASFATLLMGGEDVHEPLLPARSSPRPVTREQILAQARAVGERIESLALQNEVGAYWLGVNYVDENFWSLFPTGPDLYNGAGGIALFLAYLSAVTGEESYTRLARGSLVTVRAQINEQIKSSPYKNIGAFSGLGGHVYLLSHLGALWNEPALFLEAEELVEHLPPLVQQDSQLDIINGSAGCILGLLALHSVHPVPRILEVAVQCGDHLLARAQKMPTGIAWETIPGERPLGGFSHGTSGIAYSLLKLAHYTKIERFWQAALEALAYDRSLYVPDFKNWADLRLFPGRKARSQTPPDETVQKAMVAWCHGAPGIGLGRLGALEQLDSSEVRAEIDTALDTTVQAGMGGNHSLCHGALGNLELILAAAQRLNRPGDWADLAQATAHLLGSIEVHGWVSAVPNGVETPGLMIGLAGIGYELLRLAEPEQVPSVLLLEPPSLAAVEKAS